MEGKGCVYKLQPKNKNKKPEPQTHKHISIFLQLDENNRLA